MPIKKFNLSQESISKILKNFPKITSEVVSLISDCINDKLWVFQRLPGMKKEHLNTTGLCGELSGAILKFLQDKYDVKIKRGWFKLDKHPRFKENICSLHYWLEIDNKIIDFTANQFQPFVNEKIPEVLITDTNNTRYMKSLPANYKDVGLDDDFILEWYINSL